MLKPKVLRHFMLLSGFALVASTKAMIAVDAHAQGHMRSLSAANTPIDRYEERFWEIISEMLDSTLASGNFFASEQYQKWAIDVFGAFEDSAEAKVALFDELKNRFGDYKLATFVLDGLASLKTEAVAKEYYDLLMQEWVANKKPHDVFHALKLDSGKGNVFKNPLLETYLSFARRLPREGKLNEKPIYDELFSMLEQRYGIARLAEMLGAPNVDLRKGSVGDIVMNTLFWHVSSKRIYDSLDHVKSVFVQYAVEDSSALSIWLSYAECSLRKADYKELVIGILDRLWNQREFKIEALATVIATAQKDESTLEAASNTLEKLFVEWDNEKKSTSDVLNILGLKPAEMKAMDMTESPLLETWFAFEARGQDTDAELLKALLSQLTEEQLASMIGLKTANPIIRNRVYKVEEALFGKWQTEAVDEDGAFVRLRLDKAGDNLFAHPALSVWYIYVVNHYSPGSSASITRVVKTHYCDTDSLLVMVNRELKKKGHSFAKSIAKILNQKEIPPLS